MKTCNTLSLREIKARDERLASEEAKAERVPLWKILSPGQMTTIFIVEAISLYVFGFIINKIMQ